MSDRRLAARTARTGNEAWLAGGGMGDVLDGLKKEGHISDSQYIAGCWLLQQMQQAHGSSGGLVPQLGERVQCSTVQRLYPPGGGNLDSFIRMENAMRRLRNHERELLNFLIVRKELGRGSLADWGRSKSGYEHGRAARAFTTGHISAALSSLEEVVGLPRE